MIRANAEKAPAQMMKIKVIQNGCGSLSQCNVTE